jgi:hypothetical protein
MDRNMKESGRTIRDMELVLKYLRIIVLTKESISKIRCKDRVNTVGQLVRLTKVNSLII